MQESASLAVMTVVLDVCVHVEVVRFELSQRNFELGCLMLLDVVWSQQLTALLGSEGFVTAAMRISSRRTVSLGRHLFPIPYTPLH